MSLHMRGYYSFLVRDRVMTASHKIPKLLFTRVHAWDNPTALILFEVEVADIVSH